jgi:hypothetical protein
MPEFKPINPEKLSVPAPEVKGDVLETASLERSMTAPVEKVALETQIPIAPASIPKEVPVITPITPLQRQIEGVLAEGLEELYRALNPVEQEKFRKTGEVTAVKISLLLQKVKIKVSEILKLIRVWLSTIPGVNKYFIEQTSKIKADKIFKLH